MPALQLALSCNDALIVSRDKAKKHTFVKMFLVVVFGRVVDRTSRMAEGLHCKFDRLAKHVGHSFMFRAQDLLLRASTSFCICIYSQRLFDEAAFLHACCALPCLAVAPMEGCVPLALPPPTT